MSLYIILKMKILRKIQFLHKAYAEFCSASPEFYWNITLQKASNWRRWSNG